MRVFKRITAFILFNLLVLLGLQFLLCPPAVYEKQVAACQEGDYDSIIIGTSYGKNLLPEFLPEGGSVCNLSRPRVPLVDFSYIVKEINKHTPLKRVYYDISVSYWDGSYGEPNRINMMKILSGREQLSYFFRVLTTLSYNDFFFRYELDTPSLTAIPATVKAKISSLFQEQEPKVYTVPESRPGNTMGQIFDKVDFSPDQVQQTTLDAFDDLVHYCEENGIELVIYINAYPEERLLTEDMGVVHDYFAELLRSYCLTLYDMNYVKHEYFPRDTDEYLDLDGHMLRSLAQRQTEMLTTLITAENPDLYFETSYRDVLASLKAGAPD